MQKVSSGKTRRMVQIWRRKKEKGERRKEALRKEGNMPLLLSPSFAFVLCVNKTEVSRRKGKKKRRFPCCSVFSFLFLCQKTCSLFLLLLTCSFFLYTGTAIWSSVAALWLGRAYGWLFVGWWHVATTPPGSSCPLFPSPPIFGNFAAEAGGGGGGGGGEWAMLKTRLPFFQFGQKLVP